MVEERSPNNVSSGVVSGGVQARIAALVRTLRSAGLPVGVGAQLNALQSTTAIGVSRRAALVSSPEQTPLFHQAFALLFDSGALPGGAQVMPRRNVGAARESLPPGARRLGEVLSDVEASASAEVELFAQESASRRERLQQLDFEQMTLEELAQAKALLRNTTLAFKQELTRRYAAGTRPGPVDFPSTLRLSLRTAGEPVRLSYRSRRRRPPTLVLLCDISGSMGRYSRMFLHFAHAMTNARDRVHTLVFGTRLTNISRSLRRRDVDAALDRVSTEVVDWHGGTRIGDCLKAFNHHWSRRLLGQGATVLLLSDGLERDSEVDLDFEARRLALSSRRLIWLNPLLRYGDFKPRAGGVRQLLPHVDEFRAAHNIDSLLDLARLLA